MITYRTDTIDGNKNYLSYFPPLHRSILYLLHGTTGGALSFSSHAEEMAVAAVSRGYGVVVPESDDRVAKKWDNTIVEATNRDALNLRAFRHMLKSRGKLDIPIREFAVGMSSGASHALLEGLFLDALDGVALTCHPGLDEVINDPSYTCPTFFVMGGLELDKVAGARKNHAALAARGVRTELHVIAGVGHDFTMARTAEMFAFFEA